LNVKFTTRQIRIDTAGQPCNDAAYAECGTLTRLKHESGGENVSGSWHAGGTAREQ